MSKEKGLYDLKNTLKKLSRMRGRHTELISVYVSSGYDLNLTNSLLGNEQGTAENIKSKTTRKNVTAALKKIQQHLKLFKKNPENGLALFCGNVAEQEGQADFILEAIVPPKKLRMNLYRCSQKFVLEPLYEMLEDKESYGIIVIDRHEADIALLKGTAVEPLVHLDSFVPGKHRAGGQSSQRFERGIEEMAHDFYKKVSDVANKSFTGIKDLQGILLGGPGLTKQEFLDVEHLNTDLKKKIIGMVDTGYTGEAGIDELLHKSKDILKDAEIMKEKALVDEFMTNIAKDTGLAAYGEEEVEKAINAGAVEVLLLSEKIPEDKMEKFAELAESAGSRVEIISVETKEGEQLYNLSGFGAILRFNLFK